MRKGRKREIAVIIIKWKQLQIIPLKTSFIHNTHFPKTATKQQKSFKPINKLYRYKHFAAIQPPIQAPTHTHTHIHIASTRHSRTIYFYCLITAATGFYYYSYLYQGIAFSRWRRMHFLLAISIWIYANPEMSWSDFKIQMINKIVSLELCKGTDECFFYHWFSRESTLA